MEFAKVLLGPPLDFDNIYIRLYWVSSGSSGLFWVFTGFRPIFYEEFCDGGDFFFKIEKRYTTDLLDLNKIPSTNSHYFDDVFTNPSK